MRLESLQKKHSNFIQVYLETIFPQKNPANCGVS